MCTKNKYINLALISCNIYLKNQAYKEITDTVIMVHYICLTLHNFFINFKTNRINIVIIVNKKVNFKHSTCRLQPVVILSEKSLICQFLIYFITKPLVRISFIKFLFTYVKAVQKIYVRRFTICIRQIYHIKDKISLVLNMCHCL